MSSRLFEAVREKRALCYDVSTEVRKYKDSGGLIIHLGVGQSKIIHALDMIMKELQKIKQRCVGPRELGRAKDFFIGQTAMALEQPQSRMFYCAKNFITLGEIPTLREIKERIAAVTPRDIQELARKIFTFSHMGIACVGDISEDMNEKLRAVLKKGGRHS